MKLEALKNFDHIAILIPDFDCIDIWINYKGEEGC